MLKKTISIILVIIFTISIISCGSTTYPVPKQGEEKKIARIVDGPNIVAGICSGLAYYTGSPVWIWRAGFVIFTLCGGAGIVAYLVIWAFMPKYDGVPSDFKSRTS